MTDFEQLKQQIEQYVRTGMTEQKRQQLIKQAGDIGINPGQLVMLIKNAELELKFATGISNTEYPSDLGSGFMMAEQASGFVSSDSQADSESTMAVVVDNTPKVDPPAPQPNQFTEIKKLPVSGAMSDVYSAIHLGRRKVIIKRIKPEYRYNKHYIDLFYKEFDTGYSLENTNIVHFYGKGEDAEGPYYYMEYVDGRTLHDFIHVEQNPKEEIIQKITHQLLDALKYMHQKQVYHRDLKPDNIMLTYKGDNVKIIDFGLAAADSLVDNLAKAGTPKYAAPELMSKASTADQRSDIYSLGMIIIEMFTRHPDRRWLKDIPSEKLRIVADKCTMADPNDRYQSCDEILRFLLSNGAGNNPMPQWLEAKIKEYAADGVITRNERTVLDKEIAKAGVDRGLAEAIISDEIEKAIARRRKEELDRRNRTAAGLKNVEEKKSGFWWKLLVVLLLLGGGYLAYCHFVEGKMPWDGVMSQSEEQTVETFVPGEIVYTTTNVNLRALASKDSKVIMVVAKNKPVEVISDGYFWVEVKVDNRRGYMAKEYLSHTFK